MKPWTGVVQGFIVGWSPLVEASAGQVADGVLGPPDRTVRQRRRRGGRPADARDQVWVSGAVEYLVADGGAGVGDLERLPTALLQRTFLKMMAHQRWANIYLANVPGPAEQLHISGAPLLDLFPLVPLIGNVTLGVGALSYTGQLALTVVADAAACPDLDAFADGLSTTLTCLAEGGR